MNAWIASKIVLHFFRDTLLRSRPKLRDRLAQETDPIKVQEMIDADIYRALDALWGLPKVGVGFHYACS